METNKSQKSQKSQKNKVYYDCSICNYTTSNKTDYNKHLMTLKHQDTAKPLTLTDDLGPQNPQSLNTYICECGRHYKHRQSLFSHKKKCSHQDEIAIEDDSPLNEKEIIMTLLQQNNQLQNQIIELCKDKSVTNINNTGAHINSHNKTFNLNVFLNETCKDAMNITDFVNSLQVQITDLEKTGKIGYVEGISGIFLRGLRELDYTMRPIHCTDLKRETVYVKDENSWEKDDDEKAKLKLAIQRVARKNMRTLPKWQEENPDFRILDTKENDDYLKIALNSMGGQTDTEHEKYVDKIMRNVLKEVVIEKK